MKQLISILILFFLVATSYAAAPPDSSKQIPVGYWRTHLSYLSVTQVAETPERVYGLSDGALFSYDKESNSFDVLSKIDGLSDNKVSFITYNLENQLLLVVYDNSNIDLVTDEGKIFNILDIKEKNTSLDKTINSVMFFGTKAYLTTGYGISIVNLIKHEIADTYLLNKNTFSTAILNNKIYAATDKGIMTASINANLVDPSNWAVFNSLVADQLTLFKGELIALKKSEGIFHLNGNDFIKFYSSDVLSGIFTSKDNLIAYGNWQITTFTSITSEQTVSQTNLYGLSSLSSNETLWAAMGSLGVCKITKTAEGLSNVVVGKPDGPLANSPYRLKFSGNKLMIVGGGAWDDRYYTKGLMMFYQDDKWDYQKVDTIKIDNDARDFMNIVEDPAETGHYFVTSYGEGVYEFRNKKLVTIHDHKNSAIETHDKAKGFDHYDRTYGLCYDRYNNLFVTNMYTNKSIKVLTKEKKWVSLNYAPVALKESVFDLMLTKKGAIWMLSAWDSPGIFAFDTKGTIDDQSDDQYKFISSINYMDNLETRTLSPEDFFCMAEDKNGAIWVGTDMGPIVFNSPTKIFTDNFLGTRVKVPRNDGTMLADYLLENEKVSAICVDGGNRKWIGTESNGVYLVSENGQETYAHYTEDNSPLFSNKVLSIAIHPTTGEVFIGTDKGLVSYRSDAIEGKKDYSEVYAFPNPVRPGYEGLITITGLKSKSTVRIADLNGNSLFEGESAGGQIVWDGRNRQGQKPASGVYLVYASISDASEGVVTKILILK